MLRLVVTASGCGPIDENTATYMAKSASAIMVGPEIGAARAQAALVDRPAARGTPPCQTCSMLRPLPG